MLAGRYRILKQLGKGAFGHTYLAEDTQRPNNPPCVVKQLKPEKQDRLTVSEAHKRFPTEAKTLNMLGEEHSQIPRLLAHFEENNEFYLVQEFIDGSDLDVEIKEGRQLEEAKVFKIVIEVLDILSFVHQKKVIHRDIKPSNIMRRKDGKLVLIDFGTVKQVLTQVSNVYNRTMCLGTRGYMPKEQIRGEPQFASDVYAVGVMAIFALTGIYPLQIPENRETGQLQWRDRIKINSKLADVLDKMVQRDYRDRYASAAEALEALRNSKIPPSNFGWFDRAKPYLITSSLVLFLGSLLFIKSSEITSICSILNNCSTNIELQQKYQTTVALAIPTLAVVEDSQALSDLNWKQLTEHKNRIEQLIAELETIPQSARVYPQVEETIKDWNTQLNLLDREMEIKEPIW